MKSKIVIGLLCITAILAWTGVAGATADVLPNVG